MCPKIKKNVEVKALHLSIYDDVTTQLYWGSFVVVGVVIIGVAVVVVVGDGVVNFVVVALPFCY